MRLKLCSVLHIFVIIATTQAAIKDFIIEDEKDLERFAFSNTDEDLDDYDSLNEWPYSEEGGGSCDVIDMQDSYDNYDANYEAGEGLQNGQLDSNILREVIRQIKNDPRFKHLRDHLNEENVYFDQDDHKKLPDHYVDVNTENNMYDEYE